MENRESSQDKEALVFALKQLVCLAMEKVREGELETNIRTIQHIKLWDENDSLWMITDNRVVKLEDGTIESFGHLGMGLKIELLKTSKLSRPRMLVNWELPRDPDLVDDDTLLDVPNATLCKVELLINRLGSARNINLDR